MKTTQYESRVVVIPKDKNDDIDYMTVAAEQLLCEVLHEIPPGNDLPLKTLIHRVEDGDRYIGDSYDDVNGEPRLIEVGDSLLKLVTDVHLKAV